jgi:multiple sugar transport system permease protein
VTTLAARYRDLPVKKQEALTAVGFILPFLAGFLLFHLVPIAYAFFISFLDFNGFTTLADVFRGDVPFVGLENFKRIFTDRVARQSLINTAKFSVMYVPLKTAFALFLALLLNERLFLGKVSRSLMLMPYVANVVAIAIVFTILLDDAGPINELFRMLGVETPPRWLLNARTALPTVVVVAVWQTSSYTAIIFLAALQNVPDYLYESATIDGAGSIRKFFSITWPMISPATFFVVISNTVRSFMNYALIKNLTDGGPGYQTRTLIMNIVDEAFSYSNFSFGAAQAVLLYVTLVVITVIQWKGQKRWVQY